ncbi:MAG TPA: ADP-ribosylglycohydrolase family protein [Gemmatimonadaceae bacterium]|nr:ADP-ribosylglycohydrolase family protein [Gemmatimonadaceae bacterium]
MLDAIDAAHRAGHGVYVHCWGGIGRTGTVVGCHLVRWGLGGDDALAALDELWTTVDKKTWFPRSPQTDAQCAFVRQWVEGGSPPAADAAETGSRPRRPRFLREQIRGALVGLAVGDALGAAVEFRAPGSFEPVTGMAGGGPFGLKPGQWTDDTAMALCLAESLLECDGMDLADQARHYVRWWKEGHNSSTGRCFDIGGQTAEALERFIATGGALAGATEPGRSGNGSVMRLAPVPMFFALAPRAALDACAESSRTTHGSPACLDACRYLGALIIGALQGHTKVELLAPRFTPVPGYWDDHPLGPEVGEVADGSFRAKEPPEIQGTGYVVRTLEAALWAFRRSGSFREGALMAANLGNDADTTAAVYGQLAGAFHGEEGIPLEWRATLARWPTIDRLAGELVKRAIGRAC